MNTGDRMTRAFSALSLARMLNEHLVVALAKARALQRLSFDVRFGAP
jgi:hypothetical protein